MTQLLHAALAVSALLHTGDVSGQSAVEPTPALPRQAGVAHVPLLMLQTWPLLHCESTVHCTTSVPLLVTPALVAWMVCDPTDKSNIGMQLQAPVPSTAVVHTNMPLAMTVTDWPGTPTPVIAGRVCVVVAVPPSGGLLSVTNGATQANVLVL